MLKYQTPAGAFCIGLFIALDPFLLSPSSIERVVYFGGVFTCLCCAVLWG